MLACRLRSRSPLPTLSRRCLAQVAAAQQDTTSLLKRVVLGPTIAPVPPVPSVPSSSLLPYTETKMTTLANGLRVVTQPGAGELANVGVCVDVGSRYETEENNGTAHFLEHVIFKGSSKFDQAGLERYAEQSGSKFHAFTSRENTTFFVEGFQDNLKANIEALSDIVQTPTLSDAAIECEKSTILKEIEEVDLQHSELVFEKLHQMAFRGHSLGRPIIGSPANVSAMTREHLSNFIRTHYTANRMIVVGTGAVDHAEFCNLVEANFSKVASAAAEGAVITDGGKPWFVGSDIRMREDSDNDAHISFAFEGLPWGHRDQPVLSVIPALLGALTPEMNSRDVADSAGKLSRVLAEENLATRAAPFNTPYNDTGLVGLYIVTKPESVVDVCWQAQEEVTRLSYEVDEDDVKRAVNQVKSESVYSREVSEPAMHLSEIGAQIFRHGRYINPKEMFDRLDLVDAAAVRRVASELVNDRDLVLSAIGPISKVPDYGKLRRRTYWLRY